MSENQNNTDNKNKELGALWKRKSRNGGQTYLAGHVISENEFGEEVKTRVVVFSNSNKKSENSPDFRVYEQRPLESNTNATPEAKKETVETSGSSNQSSEPDPVEDVL